MIWGQNICLRVLTEQEIPKYVNRLNDPRTDIGQSFTFVSPQTFFAAYRQDNFLTADSGILAIDCITAQKTIHHVGTGSWYVANRSLKNMEIAVDIYDPQHDTVECRSQAVYALCDYLFSNHPLERLQTLVSPDEKHAQKAVCACGFKREGLLKSMFFARGEWRDLVLYSVLRKELRDALR